MANALINSMSNGVSNNYSSNFPNRYPINFLNNYQGYRSVGIPGQSSGPQTNVIWINDVMEVYSYPITNDSQLLFGDQKNNTFYYRIVDKTGSLVQVSRLPFTIEVIFPTPVANQKESTKEVSSETDRKESPENNVISKDEYEKLLGAVKDINEKIDKLEMLIA